MHDETTTNHQTDLALSVAGGQPIFSFGENDIIIIREDITKEEYVNGLKFFKNARNKIELGFSSYQAFGRIRFGSIEVDAMLGQLQFNLNDVKRAVQISSVPAEIKHPNLTSDHYIAIAKAGLTKADQKKWAKIASTQALTPPDLKASIEAGEVTTAAQARKQTLGVVTIHAIRQDWDIYERRLGGIEAAIKMEENVKEEILREMEAMARFYTLLHASVGASAKPAKKKAVKKPAKKKA